MVTRWRSRAGAKSRAYDLMRKSQNLRCHTAAIQIGFRHNFWKKCPQDLKNRLESCVSRFSTICAKNIVLKLKIDKVTVIRVTKCPF